MRLENNKVIKLQTVYQIYCSRKICKICTIVEAINNKDTFNKLGNLKKNQFMLYNCVSGKFQGH